MLIRAMALRTLRTVQWQFTEVREGTLDERFLAEQLPLYRAKYRGEGVFRWPLGEYWASLKHQFPPDFEDWYDDTVAGQAE